LHRRRRERKGEASREKRKASRARGEREEDIIQMIG
jgi:hypothetical protein